MYVLSTLHTYVFIWQQSVFGVCNIAQMYAAFWSLNLYEEWNLNILRSVVRISDCFFQLCIQDTILELCSFFFPGMTSVTCIYLNEFHVTTSGFIIFIILFIYYF